MKTRNLCVGLMLSIVLIAVVGFSMASCSQPEDSTTINFPDNTPGSLPAFTLNATVYTGGVLLTWDVVKDASGYEVWRYEAKGGAVRLASTVGTQLKYADIKSRLNDLQAISYKYTVLALSKASPKETDAPVPIYNSKAEKTVQFTAANLAATTLTPVSNLRLEITPSSNVLATWDADANPLVSYQILTRNNLTTTPNTAEVPFFVYTLPSGTAVDVIVRKVLYKTAADDAPFYSPSDDANAAITVFNWSNAGINAGRESNALVKLTLSNISPDTGLASFELSRYKYATSSAENPSWTPVSLASARLTASSTLNTYEVYDTLPGNSENSTFVYRLTGKYPGVDQIRTVAYSNVVNPLYNVQSLADIILDVHVNEAYSDTPSNINDDLEAYFYANHSVESEVAYTYFLKQTSHSNGMPLITNPTVDYDWLAITPASVTDTASGKTVKVPLPEARTTYSFKVVATGTGSKAGYIGQENLEGGIQLRDSIIPFDNNYINAGYFMLSEGDATSGGYWQRGVRHSTTDAVNPIAKVYSLNLDGLKGYSNLQSFPLLRAGETLFVELVSLNGAPQQTAQEVARATTTITDTAGNSSTFGGNPGTLDYFFTIPAVNQNTYPGGRYEVRLYITAK